MIVWIFVTVTPARYDTIFFVLFVFTFYVILLHWDYFFMSSGYVSVSNIYVCLFFTILFYFPLGCFSKLPREILCYTCYILFEYLALIPLIFSNIFGFTVVYCCFLFTFNYVLVSIYLFIREFLLPSRRAVRPDLFMALYVRIG